MVDLERLHDNDPEYFGLVVEEYGPLVWCVARDHASDQDDAEDLYQRTWVQVWTKRTSFTGRGTFKGWLRQVATNLSRSHRRSRSRETRLHGHFQARHPCAEATWHPLDPLAAVEGSRVLRKLRRAIDELPARQRTAVLLRYIDARSSAQTAAKMGVTQATVRSLLRHAIHGLRRSLLDADQELHRARSIRL